jgi:PKD repeat protein
MNDSIAAIPYALVNATYTIEPFSFTYEPSTPRATQPVFFTAPKTNQSLIYSWNFGDGTGPINSTEFTVGHVYSTPGTYDVSLICILNQTFASSPATETITVLPPQPTIEVTTDVGDLHFRGEIAEFTVLTTDDGQPVNATEIQALLYHTSALYVNLTSSLKPVATGFYTIPFNIPIDAETGRYTLLVEAEYYNAEGTSQTGFQINPTLTSSLATIAEIKNDTATIITGSNSIRVSLTAINATVTSINGTTALIDSKIGTLQTNLSTINATIIAVRGDTETISTTLGTVTTKLDNIQSTATTTMYAASILSALAVILAIAILILVIRARKK